LIALNWLSRHRVGRLPKREPPKSLHILAIGGAEHLNFGMAESS